MSERCGGSSAVKKLRYYAEHGTMLRDHREMLMEVLSDYAALAKRVEELGALLRLKTNMVRIADKAIEESDAEITRLKKRVEEFEVIRGLAKNAHEGMAGRDE